MIGAIDFQGGLEDAWSRVATFVPKLLGFLVILIIGYFVAKALAKIAGALLERVGFDGLVERGSLKTAFERSKFDPSDVVGVAVYWAVFLIALQLAFGVFGPNPVSELIQGIIAYLPNVIVAVIILVIVGALAKVVTEVLSAMLGSVQAGAWISRGAGFAIIMLGVFAVLDQLKVAPAIVNGLFYAILAIVVGSGVVAIGGGGIKTMQRYWERTSTKLESTASEVKQNADPDAATRAMRDRLDQEKAAMSSSSAPAAG
jgi:hypothetical protein